MTPEQAKAMMQMRANAIATAKASKTAPQVPMGDGGGPDAPVAAPVAPPAPPEPSWKEALGDMVQNSQGSDWKKAFIDPLLSPVDTLNSIGDMADTLGERYIPGMKRLNEFAAEHGAVPGMTEERRTKADEALSGLSSHFGNYTTRRGMKENVAKGLPTLLGDATLLAPTGAGLASRTIKGSKRSPQGMVDNILRQNPNAKAEFEAMTGDKTLADVTGKEGRDLIRGVTKESGEASDVMEAATTPRSQLHDSILEETVSKIRDGSRVERNKAYEDAYKEGGEMPYTRTNKGDSVPEPFVDLLKDGVAREAYKEAVPKVADFETNSGTRGGPLAEIDMTQRILSDAARAEELRIPQGKGSPTTAKQLRDAAAALKAKADEVLGTPAYAKARELGEKTLKDIEEATIKHNLDVAKQKATQKSISKAAPTEGISLTEIAAGSPALAGLAIAGMVPTTLGVTAAVASGIPGLIAAGSRLRKRALKSKGPEIARILSSKEFPANAKRTLIDSILSKSKKVRKANIPGILTRDDRE